MLRFTTSYSAEAAEAYLDAALQVGDYYVQDRDKLRGRWGGLAAERLGLSGLVERAQFLALAKNLLPNQGKKEAPWTLRTNTTRKAPVYDPKTGLAVLGENGEPVLQEVSNRRVGYGATFPTRSPRTFTGIRRAKQSEKSALLAPFSVQIARFSRESRVFARKLG